jgi:hypothetical protein
MLMWLLPNELFAPDIKLSKQVSPSVHLYSQLIIPDEGYFAVFFYLYVFSTLLTNGLLFNFIGLYL